MSRRRNRGKATAAQIDQRVAEVSLLLSRDATRSEILQYAAKSWGVSARQADEYTARARAQHRAVLDEDIAEHRAMIASWFRCQYRAAVASKNPAVAIQAGRELAKLLGLYAAPTGAPEVDPNTMIRALIEAATDDADD